MFLHTFSHDYMYQLENSFVIISWCYWPGRNKSKNAFRLRVVLNALEKLLQNLKFFYLAEFFTDWLIDWLTLISDRCNPVTAGATGMFSWLINVKPSHSVLFRQPQQLQCLHYGSIKAFHCSPLCPIPFSTAQKVTICGMNVMASEQDLVAA